MNKLLIAHELGHAVCAETQDGYWSPTGLSFEGDDGALAYCYCEKHDEKKPDLSGPYSKLKQMMNLGGIFGELLYGGNWSPWGARCDVDEFISANSKTKNTLMLELDGWNWIDDDKLSFRACTKLSGDKARRAFLLDAHDTATRLPSLWSAYLDFCNRIDKAEFFDRVDKIAKQKDMEIGEKQLKKMVEEILT